MAEETLLDAAHQAMEAAPEDGQARLAFYERLAAGELFLLLESEDEGEEGTVSPRVFTIEGQGYVLAFDREERLARFAEGPAALCGAVGARNRRDTGRLRGSAWGSTSRWRLRPSCCRPRRWRGCMATLSQAPDETEARAQSFHAPAGLPESLLGALDARLASAAGLAELAYLVGVTYEGGAKGHMLGIVDAVPGAEGALARAVADVLSFSGLEAAALDVAFFRGSDPVAARLARVGLRFDLPRAQEAAQTPGASPGMDPGPPRRA